MSTHNIGFAEAILICTHNIGFYEGLTKITFQLSSNIHLICSSVDHMAYLLTSVALVVALATVVQRHVSLVA